MTNADAARIIRGIIKDQRARTTREEVEALDHACLSLAETDDLHEKERKQTAHPIARRKD